MKLFRRRSELSPSNVDAGWASAEEWYEWEAPRNLVAGESYRQKELRKLAHVKKLRAGGVIVPVEVCFIREPSNEHDRNAFRAEINGQLIGYLRRDAAKQIAPTLDRANCTRFTVAGILRGGSIETPSVGCHVWMTRRTTPTPPPAAWYAPRSDRPGRARRGHTASRRVSAHHRRDAPVHRGASPTQRPPLKQAPP